MKNKMKINIVLLTLLITLLMNIGSNTSAKIQLNATSPTITGEDLMEFDNPGQRRTINWTVVDDDIKEYELFLDNVIVSTNEWLAPQNPTVQTYTISYDIELDAGDYVFTLTVIDHSNLQSTITTTVKINADEGNPGILPVDITSVFIGFVTIGIIVRQKHSK